MIVARTIADLRAELQPHRRAGRTIGFVPTMGALHDGHLSLLRAAADAADTVVISIFVNPLQFGPGEDLMSYPRNESADLEIAERLGAGIAFCPSVEEMYPEELSVSVTVGSVGDVLEGQARPGHFQGVATVVAKLFNIVGPDCAFFGQKDAQQVAVIRRMVLDLSYPVGIIACPTVRARDGVALSSRNLYLSSEGRSRATVLVRALESGEQILRSGGTPKAAEERMWKELVAETGVEPGYAAAVDPVSFGPPLPNTAILLAIAARVGSTRLIDNRLVDPSP